MRRALVALLPLVAIPAAFAWNSGPDLEGPAAARVIWDDEHRDFYRALLEERGFVEPGLSIPVYTDGAVIEGDLPTVAPAADWAAVVERQPRAVEAAMFADLPDFSWSLAGWTGGNEGCPLGADYASGCMALKGWLGGLNSTHFPPQSARGHAFYHQLALATAQRCAAMSTGLDGLGYGPDGYGEVIDGIDRQCELEALAFEGVAQHYLQDAWSSGHMWQRWGSPSPGDWSGRAHAMAVGLVAGLVHGHEPLTGIADPLCAPHDDVVYVPGGGGPAQRCVGDLYLADVLDGEYPAQLGQAWACAGGSLDEVAEALPGTLGLASTGLPAPTQEACFEQRVTNHAYYTGLFATWRFSADTVANTIRALGRLRFVLLRLPPQLRALVAIYELAFRRDAVAMAILLDASRWSANNPPGATNFAEGVAYRDDGTPVELTVLGMRPNGAYADQIDPVDGFATFDPPAATLATGDGGTEQQRADADVLRRGLHRAHADWWCDALGVEGEDSELGQLRAACQEDPAGHGAVCDLCGELALRHHRIGTSIDDYDAGQEPVCHALAADPGYVYVPVASHADRADPRGSAVRDWCRADCAVKITVHDVVTGQQSATDDVDADVVLADYMNQLQAYVIYYGGQAAYWQSQGQLSLAEYYRVLQANKTTELLAVTDLAVAVASGDAASARLDGGPPDDDYAGFLNTLVGYVTADWVSPGATSFDDIATSVHTFVAAPVVGDKYPFLVTWDLKAAHVVGEPGIVVEARDFLWLDGYFDAWTTDPVVTLLLDGTPWVSGTMASIAQQTASARFTVGETHELAVRLDATVYDPATLPNLQQTIPLRTTLFSIVFTVGEGGAGAICE